MEIGLLFVGILGFIRELTDMIIGTLLQSLGSSKVRQDESQNRFGVDKDKSMQELVELGLLTSY
jgi:hypothetical protein